MEVLKVSVIYIYIYIYIDNNCGCSRIDDEVEGLQHWCRNALGHGPKEESRLRKGTDKSKYSIVF